MGNSSKASQISKDPAMFLKGNELHSNTEDAWIYTTGCSDVNSSVLIVWGEIIFLLKTGYFLLQWFLVSD